MDLVQAIVAGMKDSVNPCALATASFFVLALLILGRSHRSVTVFGGYFLSTAFLVNLAILLGYTDFFLGTFQAQNILRAVQSPLGYGMIFLGGIHLYDWWCLRAGSGKNGAIIPYLSPREIFGHFLKPVAIVSGFVLTVVQSIWPPDYNLATLFYTIYLPGKFFTVFLAMAIYTFFVMLPMILFFGLFHATTQNNSLGVILEKHTAMIKIVLAGFFVSLGFSLIKIFS